MEETEDVRMGDGGGHRRRAAGGTRLVAAGFVMMAALFLIYGRYQDPASLTPDAIHVVQRLAYGFYVALLASLGAVAYGLYRYHASKVEEWRAGVRDLGSVIAIHTWNKRSRRIFAAVFVGYGLFFSLASGTLVYQPGINFATHYGAEIPSGFVSPCCDAPGYMPKIIVYMTETVGLQVVPVNIVLQVVVSYLVGLNASVAAGAYSVSKKRRGLGTVGAATGLFVACPTCAGTFLSLFVGTAGGIAASAALVQVQTLLIAVCIPVLLATPYLMARRLRDEADGDQCRIDCAD